MTQATKYTKYTIEELPTLRLPELQAFYAKVLGETTRCPNKKFLIRRITETLAEQAERHAANNEQPAQPESNPMNDASERESTAERKPVVEPEPAAELEPADEPELATEPEPMTKPEPADASPADSTSSPATAAPSATGDKPLTKLTVEELQQRYEDVVGRSTGSSHRRY